MRTELTKSTIGGFPEATRDGTWIAIVVASTILLSRAFACATPFAAIAALAGTRMSRRTGLMLAVATWLVNQLVGFCILGYPRTWDAFSWGAMIGIGAVLATLAAGEIARRSSSTLLALVLGFVAAFVVYEVVLFAATAFLPSGASAFSLPIVSRIFAINAVALVGLIVLHRLATAAGLLAPSTDARLSTRHA